jgi:hypothetical protein
VKTKTLLAAFLLALLVAAVGAQTSTDKKPEPKPEPKSEQATHDPKIEKLIEQLGDSDFRKRDLAVDALKAEGVKVLPALRAALKHPDGEVRRRLVDLIPSIETAALLAPKRITLDMKNKTLPEIAAELGKQPSNRSARSQGWKRSKVGATIMSACSNAATAAVPPPVSAALSA